MSKLCPTCGRVGSEREVPTAEDGRHRCHDAFHDRADRAEEMCEWISWACQLLLITYGPTERWDEGRLLAEIGKKP